MNALALNALVQLIFKIKWIKSELHVLATRYVIQRCSSKYIFESKIKSKLYGSAVHKY